MTTALHFCVLLSVAVWVGSIVFFSFVAAPSIFGVLRIEDAGRVVRTIFPRYYLLGIVCGVVANLSYVLLGTFGGGTTSATTTPVLLLAVMVLVNVYARQSLTPRINAARDAGDADKRTFDRLHRLSVRLNAFVLLSGLVVLFFIVQTIGVPTR